MIAILIVNLIAVFLLFMAKQFKLKYNLLPGVAAGLTIFFSIRKNYGNDYPAYAALFDYVNHTDYVTARGTYEDIEIGWYWLNRLFGFGDFQILLLFTTAIQFGVMAWFIMKYVERNRQWLIFAIYLFLPGLMINELSMLRQSLAMSIVILSIPWILKKKFIPAILIIFCGAFFHRSSYMALPMIFIPYIQNLKMKWILSGFTLIFLIFQFIPSGFLSIVDNVLRIEEFEKYDYYVSDDNQTIEMRSGLGFIFQFFVGCYMAYMLRWRSTGKRFFIVSLLIYYGLTPLSGVLGMINRVGLYYLQVGIVSYAELFRRSQKDGFALLLAIIFLAYIMNSFFLFFYNPTWTKAFLHYTTIFD